jgi:carbon-monoxide dehydrogenase small subunit
MTELGVSLQVNGEALDLEVSPRDLLVDTLRHQLGLTGTHTACEQGACGACTVLLDGRAVQSCLLFTVQAHGRKVITIEGVGRHDSLHPLQQAMQRHHALQCGFCTPGIIMAALELLSAGGRPTRSQIERAVSGNLCRCTGYQPIVDAIEDAVANGAGFDSNGVVPGRAGVNSE